MRLPSRQSAAAARRLETDARTVTDLKGESLINEHNEEEADADAEGQALVQVRATTKAHERALLFNTAAAADFPGRKPSEIARVNVCDETAKRRRREEPTDSNSISPSTDCDETRGTGLGVPQPRHFHHKSCCPPA